MIAPEWPGDKSGYQIALKSSLLQYKKKYSKIYYIGLTGNNINSSNDFPSVDFSQIKVKETSPLLRFLQSLLSIHPAVVRKFNSKKILSQILAYIDQHHIVVERTEVMFEDIPIAIQMNSLMKHGFKVLIRSHNVLGEAFEKLTTNGPLFHRFAWVMEVAKCRNFEKKILKDADEVYCHFGT